MNSNPSFFFPSSFFLFLSFFYLLSSTSCTQKRAKTNTEQKAIQHISSPVSTFDTVLTKGVVHRKIFIRTDSSQSYALYLPTGYSVEKRFLIIYFFDSHADGALPVEKYKSVAERYNYIMAGSNNSKNGLPWEKTRQLVKTLFDDTQEKFSVDQQRIYTGGFSGGARVAGSIALLNGGIAGVAGCGAGFPFDAGQVSNQFCFIGIAGNADFNLIELKNLDRTLERSPLMHQLLTFDGKHEWCPPGIMEEAFQNFEIAAMIKKTAPRNDSLLGKYLEAKKNMMEKLRMDGQVVTLWNLCRNISKYLDGLADVSDYKAGLLSLENSPVLLPSLRKEMEEEQGETETQQKYSAAFSSRDFDWWSKEVKNLNKDVSLKSKRLLGYLGLAAYMYSGSAMNQNMLPAADNFLKIYALLEPKNPEPHYMRAQWYMKMNDSDAALSSLKAAVSAGFKDKSRLQADEVFSALRGKQGFREIELMLE